MPSLLGLDAFAGALCSGTCQDMGSVSGVDSRYLLEAKRPRAFWGHRVLGSWFCVLGSFTFGRQTVLLAVCIVNHACLPIAPDPMPPVLPVQFQYPRESTVAQL